jgi:hypothetical protein
VNNAPPQVIVSYSPAILVPIDGALLKPVPDHPAREARDQYARDLQGPASRQLLHSCLRWLARLEPDPGPWSQAFSRATHVMNRSQQLESGAVDLLTAD